MGSNMIVDLINYKSANGKCKTLERAEVQGKIMDGSETWNTYDTILYPALSGCDFIPRLFRLKFEDIEALMRRWKDPNDDTELDTLLAEISEGKHRPSSKNSPGASPTDFVQQKIHTCIGLMIHAPVAHFCDGEWWIVPMRPLPNYGRQWCDIIGLDPIKHFSTTSVEDSYKLDIWARTGKELPSEIPRPLHPLDSSRTYPMELLLILITCRR